MIDKWGARSAADADKVYAHSFARASRRDVSSPELRPQPRASLVQLQLSLPRAWMTVDAFSTSSRSTRSSSRETMSSQSALFSFSPETKAALRKFRLTTSRARDPQALIYEIDKATGEIKQSEDTDVYSDLQSIVDELPEHAPRFVLLSHPLELDEGRVSVPYVMIYYMPVHCNADIRMRYAGAKELMRNEAQVGRVFDISDAEDILEMQEKLRDKDA